MASETRFPISRSRIEVVNAAFNWFGFKESLVCMRQMCGWLSVMDSFAVYNGTKIMAACAIVCAIMIK